MLGRASPIFDLDFVDFLYFIFTSGHLVRKGVNFPAFVGVTIEFIEVL